MDRSTCWPAVQRVTTVPLMPPKFSQNKMCFVWLHALEQRPGSARGLNPPSSRPIRTRALIGGCVGTYWRSVWALTYFTRRLS